MKLTPCLLLVATFILGSCGGSNDNNSGPTKNPVITDVAATNAFQLADNGFSSLGRSLTGTTCDATGEPTTSTVGSSTYAAEKTYCALTITTGPASTLRRSYFMTSGIQCALEKKINFAYATTPTDHNGIVLSESDSCFGVNGFDGTVDGDTNDNFTVSLREVALVGEDHDRMMALQMDKTVFDPTGTYDVTLYTKNTDEMYSAKSLMAESMSEAKVNKVNGTINFESRNYTRKTHLRSFIEGAMNPATGAFSSVKYVQLVQATGDTGAEDHSVLYVRELSNEWFNHYVGTSRASGYPQCSGVCTYLPIPYNAAFHNFSGNPLTKYNNSVMMVTGDPMTMDF